MEIAQQVSFGHQSISSITVSNMGLGSFAKLSFEKAHNAQVDVGKRSKNSNIDRMLLSHEA